MLNYNKLKYFTVVARHLNFSTAARELCLGQPTLSTHIKDLELELGVTLFDRSRRKLALTHAGQILYQEVQPFFDGEEALVRKVRAAVSRDHITLSIGTLGCDIIYALPHMIRLFQESFPNIDVDLRRMNIMPLYQALSDGLVDLAFQFRSESQDAPVLKSCCTCTVQQGRLLIAMADTHPLANREVIRAEDLKGCRIAIQSRKESPHPYLFLSEVCRKAGFQPNIVSEFQFIEPMLTAISMSDMVTVTSTLAPIRGLENIRLIEFEERVPVNLSLFWKKDSTNPAVPLFVRHVRQMVNREELSADR